MIQATETATDLRKIKRDMQTFGVTPFTDDQLDFLVAYVIGAGRKELVTDVAEAMNDAWSDLYDKATDLIGEFLDTLDDSDVEIPDDDDLAMVVGDMKQHIRDGRPSFETMMDNAEITQWLY